MTASIGICGLGTVGGSLLCALQGGAHPGLRIAHLASRSGMPQPPPSGCKCTSDPMAVADDPDVQILVELMGGTDVAHQVAVRALENGKHLVTANKALMAKHGRELLALAAQGGLHLGMEGAAAAAVPVLRSLRDSFGGNRVERIHAVLNGTCNYILEQMAAGLDYGQALARAQSLGYAEADPGLDVGGQDAASKLAIISALAFSMPVPDAPFAVGGITQTERIDLQMAKELGFCMRHLAQGERTDCGAYLRVGMALVPDSSPLAHLPGPQNGVLVHGRMSGPLYFQGAGAGGDPTASAVLADLAQIAANAAPPWPEAIWNGAQTPITDGGDMRRRFYVRAAGGLDGADICKSAEAGGMTACITMPMLREELQMRLPPDAVCHPVEAEPDAEPESDAQNSGG